MKIPAKPENESARLKALLETEILDTAPEEVFDRLTKLAAEICGTEFSVISLTDSERQWFKSTFGFEASEGPRDISFCGHTILDTKIMEIIDARTDERFSGNPYVIGEPHIRFYAGAPLIDSHGNALGTLCVFDSTTKTLENYQHEALRTFASRIVKLIEDRKK